MHLSVKTWIGLTLLCIQGKLSLGTSFKAMSDVSTADGINDYEGD